MYSWGYIKAASLAHLDISESEATTRNMLDRFPFYANEAITQICSAVKPKRSFATFVVSEEQGNVGTLLTMPTDFVSFGDDVNIVVVKDEFGNTCSRETCDDDFLYKGINKLMFFTEGTYYISYNARWIIFSADAKIVRRAYNIVKIRPFDVAKGILLHAEIYLYFIFVFSLEALDLGDISCGVVHAVACVKGRVSVPRKAYCREAFFDCREDYLLGRVFSVAEKRVSVKISRQFIFPLVSRIVFNVMKRV